MKRDAGLFGRIAVEKGFVSEERLAQALRFQEDVRAFGLSKPLGAILVQERALTSENLDTILRLQKINEGARGDRRVVRIALKNDLVKQADVDEALEVSRAEGYERGLAEILVERGRLEPSAVRAIRSAIERAGKGGPALAKAGDTPASAFPRSPTERLARRLDLDAQDLDAAPDAARARRQRDVTFAAVAVREGLVLIPELERALEEQLSRPDDPSLESVLVSRGLLGAADVRRVSEAIDAARAEKLTIPGYRVTDVLGRGATSVVLRARHELIGREVAIKVFRPEHMAATDAEALVAEARTIGKVQDPFVVGLYDVGRVHRRLFYVMELIDGPTLADAIRERGFLPEREALAVARDVARGLEAIAGAGLVHRDVKPQNIVLTREGAAKLTDLGLARGVGERDADPLALYGTPQTLAPEQANGGHVDIRADLYGLGATLFHALTGRPPFEGESAVTVIMAHVTEAVPDPRSHREEIGMRAARLVMDLLSKSPDDRPPHPRDVVEEIDRILAPRPYGSSP